MATYIVLLGPPGVGKGTQAAKLSEKTRLPHISSGDLFRENMKNDTDLGKEVRAYMDRGDLVPDDLTIAMVKDRLSRPDCKGGAILDGFPRTPPQAEALHKILEEWGSDVKVVPYVSAPPEVLVERVGGRWICRAAGHVYHLNFRAPKVAGKCDIDGSELFQRQDDKVETVSKRIEVYLKQTSPLVEYYRERKKLVEIDGSRPIEQVTDLLLAAIGM